MIDFKNKNLNKLDFDIPGIYFYLNFYFYLSFLFKKYKNLI